MDEIDSFAVMRNLETKGRVCYKSEDRITHDSAIKFVEMLIKRGHESVLEHVSFGARFIVDRGVSHEIVRHRIAAYSQESTRYCDYGGEGIVVIEPFFWSKTNIIGDMDKSYCSVEWEDAMAAAENAYVELRKLGATPQEARSVLPNSLKTEIEVTYNLREWRHFFALRAARTAHPQMQQVAIPLLLHMREELFSIFNDKEFNKEFSEQNYAEEDDRR